MGVHVIIDGYNFLHASSLLAGMDRAPMDEAREVLVDLLASYKKARAHAITVVFDAQFAVDAGSRRFWQKGIEIIFSSHGQLADAVIKNMASKEREKAVVVTSDRDVAAHAASAGAAVVSAQEFGQKMSDVLGGGPDLSEEDSYPNKGRQGAKKGPSRREPKQRRKARKKSEKL